jgi:branched-chain amino acid transport system ATP-binding protein
MIPGSPLLQVKDLCTNYGDSQVLHGISFEARRSEITCLLGRNGVGKTTTLKSVIGLVPPRSGSIRYDGRETAGAPAHRIARMGIGYVPEERRIFPTLTVLENLLMGERDAARGGTRSWSVEQALEYFPGLQRRIGSQGRFLSGGEQQMLALARALVGNPGVMLVDEPTEGLAPVIVEVARELLDFITDRWRKGLFTEAAFRFDPRENAKIYRRELKKKGLQGTDPLNIPEEAWKPIDARRPMGGDPDVMAKGSFLDGALNALRLADMAVINPEVWEPIRLRSLGLD